MISGFFCLIDPAAAFLGFEKIFSLFLIWVLFWLGFYAGGQVTIISLLTWLTAPLHKTSWDVLLSDPLLVSLMIFVIVSFILWGRGVFCGWLCPFGALQELIAKFAKFIKIRQINISYNLFSRMIFSYKLL